MRECPCHCSLCRVERQLTLEVTSATEAYQVLLSTTRNGLQAFASPANLLSYLRVAHADEGTDELLCELLAARPVNPQLVEALVVLVFLPMLHGTARRVVKRQPALSFEDVTQQALSLFLEFLRSEELQKRQSHFAFAISRTVKRQIFEWAEREWGRTNTQSRDMGKVLALLSVEEPIERHALLRHFLSRCITKGLLSGTELDLLIQFKLDGNGADELAQANSTSSNALRQKMKRLLAKLRRLAGNSSERGRPIPQP